MPGYSSLCSSMHKHQEHSSMNIYQHLTIGISIIGCVYINELTVTAYINLSAPEFDFESKESLYQRYCFYY